jgi:DNA invertase Pin-like site-specific DNA recombinase
MGGAASIAAQMSQLGDRGIGFRSLQEAIDTTPGGRVVFHVFAARPEFERRC